MNSIWRPSDKEVACAIRYLDPDLHDNSGSDELSTGKPPSMWRVKAGSVILAMCVVLYFAALRYLPALMRLFN